MRVRRAMYVQQESAVMGGLKFGFGCVLFALAGLGALFALFMAGAF